SVGAAAAVEGHLPEGVEVVADDAVVAVGRHDLQRHCERDVLHHDGVVAAPAVEGDVAPVAGGAEDVAVVPVAGGGEDVVAAAERGRDAGDAREAGRGLAVVERGAVPGRYRDQLVLQLELQRIRPRSPTDRQLPGAKPNECVYGWGLAAFERFDRGPL